VGSGSSSRCSAGWSALSSASRSEVSLTLLIATTNPDKIREIRAVMSGADVRLETLVDYDPVAEPDESATTFEGNARLKARAYAHALGPRLAVDTLVVDALDGDPGVRSARFLRADASYGERFAEIYRRLALRPRAPRDARFVCALAVTNRDASLVFETQGRVEGRIADAPVGGHGFGYDPIFFYPPLGRTLAEVSDDQKRTASHRGQAFGALVAWLTEARSPKPTPADSPSSRRRRRRSPATSL
jgi:XTP/dITP diphosphohydrolase